MITARMRSGTSWSDVLIRNVSPRGLLLHGDAAPAPGTYVEVRCGAVMIIGRTVWSKSPAFGVRAQDKIDIAQLIDAPRTKAVSGASVSADGTAERRARNRAIAAPSVAQRLERSRQISSMLQFGLLIVGALTIAGIAGSEVYGILARPIAMVAGKL